MKLSIITVCFNSAHTLKEAIASVQEQDYAPLEHIIIDGGSSDGSQQIIEHMASQPHSKITQWISQADRGIYDAMNKGVALATGEVIGFLNADDLYASPTALRELMTVLQKQDVQCVFGDLVYVDPHNTQKVLRYYNSGRFRPSRFRWGWMPAHPTFLARRDVFKRAGPFSLQYRIAADYELLIRMLWVHQASYAYIAKPLVRMRAGGMSTAGWRHSLLLNREIVAACRANGIYTNLAMVLTKFPLKIWELVQGRLGLRRH